MDSAGLTRRDTLSVLAGGSTALLAGCADSQPDTEDEAGEQHDAVDLDQLENVLEITAGTTHAVAASSGEAYDGIRWEDGGTLELEMNAAIELTEINQ